MSGHVRRRGDSWQIRYELPRDEIGQRKTRTETFKGTKREADRRLHELLNTIYRGEHVDLSKASVHEHVAARIAAWQASGKISALTAEHYVEQLAAHIAPKLGRLPLQKLNTLQIEEWHSEMVGRGLSTSTVQGAHALLSRALVDAVRHQLLARNPAQIQRPPRGKAPEEITIIAGNQIGSMLAKLIGDPFHVLVIIALFTGVRRSELLALVWSDVDLEAKVLHVHQAVEQTKAGGLRIKPPKTKAGRRAISLPDVVVDALRAHRLVQLETALLLGRGRPPDNGLIFPNRDGQLQAPRAFSLRWLRCARRLGLSINWHALRHTHASMLIAAKVDIVTISRRLGHAKPDVTLRIYAHLFAADDRAAAQAIDQALG